MSRLEKLMWFGILAGVYVGIFAIIFGIFALKTWIFGKILGLI